MLVLKIRRQHLLQAENTLSTLDTIQLTWIKHVIYGVLLVWATGLFSQVIVGWGWVPRVHEDIVVNISVSVLVIVLGYYGIRQTPIFIDLPVAFEKGPELLTPVPMITEEQTASSKYQRSGLDADKSQFYADRLASFMEQNKPYTDPELSLGSLAAQLSLSPNHLSQIINEQFGKNFWDFVNEYRIKQVIACLQAGAHKKHTLLGIALDAGFNSKVSFNRAFKKFTSETPSGYLKKL
jgi:AraC-like DNA-binding protein